MKRPSHVSGANRIVVLEDAAHKIVCIGETHNFLNLCEPCGPSCTTIEKYVLDVVDSDERAVDVYLEIPHVSQKSGYEGSPQQLFYTKVWQQRKAAGARLHFVNFRHQEDAPGKTLQDPTAGQTAGRWKQWADHVQPTLRAQLIEFVSVLAHTPYERLEGAISTSSYVAGLRKFGIPVPTKYHKIGKQLQMLAPTYRGGIVGYFVAQFLFKPIHIGKMNWSMDLYAVARLLRTWSPESRTRVLWVGQKHLETILPVLEILNFSTLEDLVSKKPNDKCLRLK